MTALHEEDDDLQSGYEGRVMRRLLDYLRPYKLVLALVFISVTIASLMQVAGPLIVRRAIDSQLQEGTTANLATLVLVYLGTLIGIFVLYFLQTLMITYVGQRVMMDMRLELFTHVERMSIAFFDRNPIGRLVTRLTNDVATIEEVLSRGIVEMLYNTLLLIAIVGTLFVLDWRLAIAMMIFVPALVYFVRKFAVALRETFRMQRAWLARLNAFLNENITGMAVVQLFNRQDRNLQRFDERNQGFLKASLRATVYFAAFEPTVVLFNAVTISTIIWYGGGRVTQDAITLGTLVAFLPYMQFFFWPVRELAERSTMFQQALASCERIFGVLDEPEEITDDATASTLQEIEGHVEFDHVWFAYDAENWVLRGISFDIQPGEAVAIVGATGAGKSTMMNLLNRFYDVQRGEIRVDGKPIKSLRQRELRREVGMVLQDPFIFTDSVLENIRMRDGRDQRGASALRGPAGRRRRVHRAYAPGLREPPLRARRQPIDGPEAADLAGPRGGVQPQDRPRHGRSDGEYRPGDGGGFAALDAPSHVRPHVDHYCAPPQHDPARQSHPRPAARRARRRGHARVAAGPRRYVCPPLRAAVQGPGPRHRARDLEARAASV